MIASLLSRVDFFSLNLSLFLSFSSFSLSLCFFFRCIRSTANRYHEDILFLFLSTLSYTNQNFWPIKSIFLSIVAQERKKMCVCVCTNVVAAFDKSRLFCPRKKCVYEKERAYQALSSFATWFIDKSIKIYIHIW